MVPNSRQAAFEEALLFLAVTFAPDRELAWLQTNVFKYFGRPAMLHGPFAFEYSDYYREEMGPNLEKLFVIFSGAYSVEKSVASKRQAIKVERKFAEQGKRTVNLDPGYLTLAKLVLTTTKNYDHRVYLGRGIFADVQLRFRNGEFISNPWTYPDYKAEGSLAFFKESRNYLREVLEEAKTT